MGSPGGSRGGPGGGPGGQKRALLGGDPCFAIFANFCNRFGGLIFSRFRVDPPRDPAPPGGGPPGEGGSGGSRTPKNRHFWRIPRGSGRKMAIFRPVQEGGGYLLFLSLPGAQKSGFLAPRAQTLRSAFIRLLVFDFNFFLDC